MDASKDVPVHRKSHHNSVLSTGMALLSSFFVSVVAAINWKFCVTVYTINWTWCWNVYIVVPRNYKCLPPPPYFFLLSTATTNGKMSWQFLYDKKEIKTICNKCIIYFLPQRIYSRSQTVKQKACNRKNTTKEEGNDPIRFTTMEWLERRDPCFVELHAIRS